jgi:hypothetical protein
MQNHARTVLAHQTAQTEAAPEPHDVAPPDPAFATDVVYKVRKRVTVPVLPFPVGATYVLRPLEAIRQSEVEDSRYGPARVCEVEAPNGEVRILIAGEVLHTALNRAYPNNGYVGAWFQVTKLPPREGKRYADYAITEIEPPLPAVAA